MLLRHAKSSWDDSSSDDISRPLAPRGEAAARAIGRMMTGRGLLPDRVLCSPALRARQTWDLVSAELPHPIGMEIVAALYDFGDGDALVEAIRSEGGASRCLMLVGHNPSLEGLAIRLAARGNSKLRARMAEKFPTCALAIFSFDMASWTELTGTGGELTHFVRPRDLEA